MLLKFNEDWARSSVNGALAIRKDINKIVDEICAEGYRNICWLGIGGTWASGMQAAVHMKEMSEIETWAENASEYNTTGNKRVGKGTVVITSSVTGSTVEVVEAVKRMQAAGAKVIGFIDIDTTELAKLVDYEIAYPVNEQLKFFMVADRFMQNHGEFDDCEEMYAEYEKHLAQALIEVEKRRMLSDRNLRRSTGMILFIILWEPEISGELPIPMQCAIGRSSYGSKRSPSPPESSFTACLRSSQRRHRLQCL